MNKKRKILIVEDDIFISEIYKVRFSQEGFDVLLASDGVEAMKILGHEIPNIILLDIIMPKMDGIKVLREIKLKVNLAGIPIILLTNISQSEQAMEGIQFGADDYLVKSNFTPTDVVNKVNALLDA